ncbi:MAG: hypothetical protein B1H40_02080 [Candidatus Latescibacteria bacterium 4484_181]|nr:MAG: hypothetical protein B1H40_02080 [Candidatus Latescibacteria bacterium 4484_181]RKY67763.1 MAG: hypothetical protein DRQ02_06320 [Candidatus Latescibacterota bacterium]RKY72984.1 MAG: hypothetical protein DRQ24_03660 [Candidatus Latescibacterota bacterium]
MKYAPKDGKRCLKYLFTGAALKAIIYYAQIKELYGRNLRKTNPPVARTMVTKELVAPGKPR